MNISSLKESRRVKDEMLVYLAISSLLFMPSTLDSIIICKHTSVSQWSIK